MTDLFRCVLSVCIFDMLGTSEWPLYIQQILSYNIFNPEIKLRYHELLNKYVWVESIFTAFTNNQRTINLSHICALFCNSDTITFLMDDDYVLTDFECRCIVDHLAIVSNMDVIVEICFKWPSNIPTANHSNIHKYYQVIRNAKWIPERDSEKHTISFECTESSLSIEGQKRFQQTIHEISSRLAPIETIQTKDAKKDPKPVITPEPLILIRRITQNDIPKRHWITVHGFIRAILTHYAPPDVFGLVLLLYAKPIQMNMKYNNLVVYILFDLVNETWDTLCLKIVSAFMLRADKYYTWKFRCLRCVHGRFTDANFDGWDCKWTEKDIFEPELYQQLIDLHSIRSARSAQQFDLQSICNAIGRYYASLDKEYDALFSTYCEDNGFNEEEDLLDEMDNTPDDCMLTEFDYDFPFRNQPDNDKEREQLIHTLITICVRNPDVRFSSEYIPDFNTIDTESFEPNKDDLNIVRAIYKKQCPALYKNQWDGDEGFLTILAVGRKYNFDYLLHLVDDFNRWRIKNQDKTDHT
eukprot:72758_1